MTRLALAVAAALTLSAPCTPAYAQLPRRSAAPQKSRQQSPTSIPAPPLCAPLKAHARYLLQRWGERAFAPGIVGRGIMVILFVNPRKRTWTLIRVVNGGIGCAVGAGRLPERAPAAPRSTPAPQPTTL